MFAKGMYTIDESGLVSVDINANYNASAPSGGSGSSQTPPSGSDTEDPGNSEGGSDSAGGSEYE